MQCPSAQDESVWQRLALCTRACECACMCEGGFRTCFSPNLHMNAPGRVVEIGSIKIINLTDSLQNAAPQNKSRRSSPVDQSASAVPH